VFSSISKHLRFTYSGRRLKKIYKWEKFKPTKEWVEENVTLSSESSPIGGKMRLRYTPHLIEMFDDYDRPEVWKQVVMFSSQTAKTSYLFCVTAKTLDTEPAPSQLMIPTSKGIPRYLTKKLNPFLNGIKTLKSKMNDFTSTEKVRERGAEIRVAGGGLSVTGSSRGERKSLSIKYFNADEIAEFEEGAVTEAIERTKSYERFFRKVLLVSTMEDPNDEINRNFNDCEVKKRWELQCPQCKEYYYFGSKELKYKSINEYAKHKNIDESDVKPIEYKTYALEDVYLECPCCSHHITTEERDTQILEKNCRMFTYSGEEKGVTIGYKANALAMYFTRLESIVELLIDAEFSLHKLAILDKVYRGYFNEFYEQESKKVDKNEFLLITNNYPEMIVPNDTVKIYLTIDTQKYGFWYTITAFTYGFNAHAVMKGFIETFDEIEMLMSLRLKDENGKEYLISKTAIDRLGIVERTAEVDAWIQHMMQDLDMGEYLFPTMGFQNDAAGRLWYYTTVAKDVATDERLKNPIRAIKINNTLVKNELNAMIERSIAKARGDEEAQNYKTRLFFINKTIVQEAEQRIENGEKSISTDYERQMTSEEYVYKIDKKSGKVARKKTWEKRYSNIDNHYWDNAVQAVALAMVDNVSIMQKPKENEVKEMLDALLSN